MNAEEQLPHVKFTPVSGKYCGYNECLQSVDALPYWYIIYSGNPHNINTKSPQ